MIIVVPVPYVEGIFNKNVHILFRNYSCRVLVWWYQLFMISCYASSYHMCPSISVSKYRATDNTLYIHES